jgi:hypothetical protein
MMFGETLVQSRSVPQWFALHRSAQRWIYELRKVAPTAEAEVLNPADALYTDIM